MHRVLSRSLAAALALGLAIATARAQNAPASPAPSTPAAAKAPTPIPLAEVVPQADSAAETLQEIRESLAAQPLLTKVEQKLPALTRDIDVGLSDALSLLRANASLDVLGRLERRWQRFGASLPLWNRLLTTRTSDFEGGLLRLDQLEKTWEETLKVARNSGAPPAVLQRAQGVIAAIRQTREEAEGRLSQALTLQGRLAEQEARVRTALASVQQARRGMVDRLLVQDSPPLWSAAVSSPERKRLAEATYTSLRRQLKSLRAYAERHAVAFFMHAAVLVLLLGLLYWERPRVRRWIQEEPGFERAAPVFAVPLATALMLSFLLSPWLYPLAPRLWVAALGAGALIPATIVLRRLLEPRLGLVLNALVAFYCLDQVREVVASLPLLSRGLFVAEMLAGICLLVWLIKPVQWSAMPAGSSDRLWRTVKAYAQIALVSFAAALVAQVLGYVALANLFASAVLGGAYLALVLYAVIRIADGLILGALKVRPLGLLRVVHRHRPVLQRRAHLGLQGLALLLWLGYVLELLALRDPVLEKLGETLGATLNVGSLHVSVAQVLTFWLTVWAAFLVSRCLRFILEEDVYQRLQLPRGLPYAISMVLHYTILLVGFLAAAAALGLDMTKFTILAGAFSVGVGFGLQNIINNFVSGLILLFERPIKVGDVIEVGEATGVVQRIGIRASVLRAVDGSELIVPNGILIANQVTNWTFSDSLRLIEVPVPIASGADPGHVLELLTGVAAAHPLVMKDPPPQAFVVTLGPGALSFTLRAWTDRAEAWAQIRSELAVAIKSILAKENVAIP